MLEGIIIKGVGGFYYVKTIDGIIESRARGVFREDNITPLVGDKVKIRLSDEDNTGYVEEIMDRKSQLTRPPVSNISQAIIVMSVKKPDINTWLLDRFLIMAEHEGLNVIICINKVDLDEKSAKTIKEIYEKVGYSIIETSVETGIGIDRLKSVLKDNISVFAGPSGAGKSSLLNKVNPKFKLETGEVSSKTRRGKHTTRHVELLELDKDSFVLDSPGFSSLNIDFIQEESELREYFREMQLNSSKCKFLSCLHDKEPDCEIRRLVELGEINKERYENYISFLQEIKNIRRY